MCLCKYIFTCYFDLTPECLCLIKESEQKLYHPQHARRKQKSENSPRLARHLDNFDNSNYASPEKRLARPPFRHPHELKPIRHQSPYHHPHHHRNLPSAQHHAQLHQHRA